MKDLCHSPYGIGKMRPMFFETMGSLTWAKCRASSNRSTPAKYWTYCDEDHGGSVARMARRRGGQRSCTATSRLVLAKFKMANPVIRML
jgi:hypothetical protein